QEDRRHRFVPRRVLRRRPRRARQGGGQVHPRAADAARAGAARRFPWQPLMRVLVIACVLAAVPALADNHVIRIATIVPDGTAYAREFRAFARELESVTNGSTKVKIYFGGVAGDELQVFDRIRRGQLDGVVSGGIICERT